ncbi:hypothetical protein [Vibrio quintilis]|uniref:hypothetical protein n=1 Tax=Vibrio quintilis TaxID=1117707 RepID=UPI000935868C|nr:hypothetical protein [Vibrio quintilis]
MSGSSDGIHPTMRILFSLLYSTLAFQRNPLLRHGGSLQVRSEVYYWRKAADSLREITEVFRQINAT